METAHATKSTIANTRLPTKIFLFVWLLGPDTRCAWQKQAPGSASSLQPSRENHPRYWHFICLTPMTEESAVN